MKTNTPYFLWDYDIEEQQVQEILKGENESEKIWLISRILTHAKYEDIWKYLAPEDIVKIFPKLKLSEDTKKNWLRALNTWGYNVHSA